MSATMARQGGWVQLEQSDMQLALNLAKIANGGLSPTTMVETQFLVLKSRAKVREEKKRGVVFSGHKEVKAAIERHQAMLCQNQTAGFLPCRNGTIKNPQT